MRKKKETIRIIILAMILTCACAAGKSDEQETARMADKPTAESIIADFRKTIDSVKSFSMVCNRTDKGDEFVVARHNDAMKAYEPILKKIEMLTRKKMLPEQKTEYKTVGDISFIKPFSLQDTLIVNDYLPALMGGAVAYFRPETNMEEVFLKEPILGIVFRRPAGSDSAAVMTSNWIYDLIEMDCALANGGETMFKGMESVNGKSAEVVEITLKRGTKPWRVGCGGAEYGVPRTAHAQLNRELGMIADRLDKYGENGSSVRYWFDPEEKLIVKKTMRFGDEIYLEQTMEKTMLNSVNAKSLLQAKKPPKKQAD